MGLDAPDPASPGSKGMRMSSPRRLLNLPSHTYRPAELLQRAMGAAPHATVSGGTPALRLNATHFVAVGHTMTWACNTLEVRSKGKAARAKCMRKNRWRAYAMFAYTFSAMPPFGLRSVSREFRMRLPRGGASDGYVARPMLDIDAALLWPPPPMRAPHMKVRGLDGKAQFPVGLSWRWPTTRQKGAGGRCVLLSWGHDDTETFVSTLPVDTLLSAEMSTLL